MIIAKTGSLDDENQEFHWLKAFMVYAGLLILSTFRLTKSQISYKSAKFRVINTQNAAKFTRNCTKYMSVQHILKLTYLGCLLDVNLQIYHEAS